jgi:hypothetical protein
MHKLRAHQIQDEQFPFVRLYIEDYDGGKNDWQLIKSTNGTLSITQNSTSKIVTLKYINDETTDIVFNSIDKNGALSVGSSLVLPNIQSINFYGDLFDFGGCILPSVTFANSIDVSDCNYFTLGDLPNCDDWSSFLSYVRIADCSIKAIKGTATNAFTNLRSNGILIGDCSELTATTNMFNMATIEGSLIMRNLQTNLDLSKTTLPSYGFSEFVKYVADLTGKETKTITISSSQNDSYKSGDKLTLTEKGWIINVI